MQAAACGREASADAVFMHLLEMLDQGAAKSNEFDARAWDELRAAAAKFLPPKGDLPRAGILKALGNNARSQLKKLRGRRAQPVVNL